VHADPDMKDSFPCDYVSCARSHDPFTRKDHFRDHLRDHHKEPIGSAKGEKRMGKDKEKWLKVQSTWFDERDYKTDWWRCAKCLVRIKISKYGYECNTCKNPCEPEYMKRVESLRQKQKESGLFEIRSQDPMQVCSPSPSYSCSVCKDTGWFWEGLENAWEPCRDCQPTSWSAAQFDTGGF
jgi:hypothetical protein